jgi:hypothetical protein
MKRIYLILLIAFAFSGCEKDDICDETTSTTPRIVLEFYDFNATTPTKKSVSKLRITGEGMTESLVANESLPTTNAARYQFNSNKILLPLRITDDSSKYTLKLNSDDVTLENEDVLQFNYSRKTLYVSRACGYKTIFELNATNPFVLTTDTDNWIKNIQIVNYNIETENEIHIKIKF